MANKKVKPEDGEKKQNEDIVNGTDSDHKFVKKDIFMDDKKSATKPSVAKKKKAVKKIKKTKSKKKSVKDRDKIIDEKLAEIYENTDGSMPDMTHFEKIKRNSFIRSLFVLLSACLFLAVVAWVGFFVLQPRSHFSESGVILSVSGEEVVQVGEVERYRIRYRNAQNIKLNNVVLQIRYPEGFVLTETSRNPSNEAMDEWMLGDMEGQDSGYIDVYGKMYGSVGQKQSFRTFLNYKAENFSSEFQKADSLTVETKDEKYNLIVEAPEQIVSGSEVELNIYVEGATEEEVGNLAIEIDSNAYFSVRDSSPAEDQFVDNRWNLKDATDGQISLIGVFDSTLLDTDGSLSVRLVGWKNGDRGVDGYVYQSEEYLVNILETDLVTNLVINGSSSNLNVQPGETLNSTVILRNAGETPLKRLEVRVVFDAPSYQERSILNWPQIDNPQDADIVGEQLSVGKRRGILTWDRDQILDLRQIDPEEEIIADFSLPIKSAQDTDLINYTGSKIDATLEVRYELDGETKIVSSAPIVMNINSDVDLQVRDEVEYNGEAEYHEITWVLTNSFHELKDIKLEADLYGDVDWHSDDLVIGAGEVTYDEENKKVIWNIDSMPTALDVLAMQFGITLNSKNPSQSNLTSKVIFEATDTITGEQILMTGKELLLGAE